MIDDGVTGIGYPWMENEHLKEIVKYAVSNPQAILDMKKNCLKKAEGYLPENVIKILIDKL